MPKPTGALIRRLRRKQGVKTGAFAKRVGICRQHMTAIEAKNMGASIEVLSRIADELGIDDVNELIDDKPAVAS